MPDRDGIVHEPIVQPRSTCRSSSSTAVTTMLPTTAPDTVLRPPMTSIARTVNVSEM